MTLASQQALSQREVFLTNCLLGRCLRRVSEQPLEVPQLPQAERFLVLVRILTCCLKRLQNSVWPTVNAGRVPGK